MFTCTVCNFKCLKRGDLNRHLQTPKHIRFVAPLQTLQLENEQLKTLVLEQQIELKKQFKRSTSHSPVRRKVFCLNHFLNYDCKDAMTWNAFVATFGMGTAFENNDITARIANIVIDAARSAGTNKRAVHCLDAKRKKMCLKLNTDWVDDASIVETTVQDAVLQIQNVLLQNTKEWQADHPNWAEHESERTHYIELVQRITTPVDFSRFYLLLATAIPLPKSS